MLSKPEQNLIKIYEKSLRENWALEAVTDYGTTNTLTYAQLAENIAKLHLLFEQAGIESGDKVAVMGKNNANWVTTFLATVTYGAIIVPILQDFKANDAIHIINHSDIVASKDIFCFHLPQTYACIGAVSTSNINTLGLLLTVLLLYLTILLASTIVS